MNNYTGAIASFIRFNVVLFNTLEYVMKKDNYDLNAFNARKEIISTEISKNTPLKSCLDNSGEAGTKLLEKIKRFAEMRKLKKTVELSAEDQGENERT